MEAIQIGTQFYVVRYEDDAKSRFVILSGPYPEVSQAIAMARLRDMD